MTAVPLTSKIEHILGLKESSLWRRLVGLRMPTASIVLRAFKMRWTRAIVPPSFVVFLVYPRVREAMEPFEKHVPEPHPVELLPRSDVLHLRRDA